MDLNDGEILITGGTGFLGANIAHYLINSKNVDPKRIRVFYLENTSTRALEGLPPLRLYPGNILDKESLKKACDGCSYIFHTVGSTSFEPRAKKIQWLINVEGTRNLIDIVKESSSINRICYTSTVNTLGCPDPIGSIGTIETSNPYTNEPNVHSFNSQEGALEFADSIHDGTGPKKWWKKIGIGYFDSKLAAQELISRAVDKDNLNIVSVLPGTFFGPYDIFIGTGLYLIQIYNNALPGVLKTGFPLTHVEDVVIGHLLAMEKGTAGEKYIITGKEGDNRYLKDMATIIAKMLKEKEPDKKIRTKFKTFPFFLAKIGALFSELYAKLFNKPCLLSRAAVKAASYPSFYSYEKANREIGYEPHRSFEEAISEMYDYMKQEDLFSEKGRRMDKILIKKDKKKYVVAN